MKKINNIFNTANKSLFAIGDTSRRSTPDSSGQRRILLSSCRGPISPLARGVPARAGCRKFGVRFAALVTLLVATPSFAEPTELDKKTVASKAYVDTKQDKITTDLVTFHEPEEQIDFTVPALVSYGTGTNNADGVLGNKIGILGINQNGGGLGSWEFLDLWDDSEAAYLDNFVPTVRAVANALESIWDNMPDGWSALTWDSAETTSTNAYETKFVGDTGATANAWPSADKTKLINTAALAKGLALKQNKIPATLDSSYHSVLTDGDTDGAVGKLRIITPADLNDGDLFLDDFTHAIPDTNAVSDELFNHWQPKITTGLVTFENGAVQGGTSGEDDLTVRALVATNANGTALNGNTIGIVDQDTFGDSDKGALRHYNVDYEMDNFVPTVRAVATALQNTQSILGPAWTSTTGTSEMASTGGQTIDLRTTRGEVGQRYITAGGSQPLTQKTGADNVILYINGTKTLAQYQTSNFGATGSSATENQNYIKGALVSLELLKDVYGELNAKITNALPAGTAGNVVTYSGTAGTVSARGVYNNPSSEYFDNPNINENELITVNAAAAIVDYVDARAPEITCAGVEPSTNECWLWTIPTYTTTTRPLPRGDGRTDVWVTGFTAKVSCINAIRENTSITGLIEARDAVENAPTRVATGLSSTAASNLVSTLVSGGCTAEIRNP